MVKDPRLSVYANRLQDGALRIQFMAGKSARDDFNIQTAWRQPGHPMR
jgi:hypothetical protein